MKEEENETAPSQNHTHIIIPNKVSKRILKEGELTSARPQPTNQVQVYFRSKMLDGLEFYSYEPPCKPFTFLLGFGKVVPGWQIALLTMAKGEICELFCSPEYAYGEKGWPPKIGPNTPILFEIELVDFWSIEERLEDAVSGAGLQQSQKISLALKLKEIGNQKFKNGQEAAAIGIYERSIQLLEPNEVNTSSSELLDLLKTLRLNLAQGYLRSSRFMTCVQICSMVLKNDPNNLKALYRRGAAFWRAGEHQNGKNDLVELLKLDNYNQDAIRELQMLMADKAELNATQKRLFSFKPNQDPIKNKEVPIEPEDIEELGNLGISADDQEIEKPEEESGPSKEERLKQQSYQSVKPEFDPEVAGLDTIQTPFLGDH